MAPFPTSSELLLEKAAQAIDYASREDPRVFHQNLRAILKTTFEYLTTRLDEYDRLAMEQVLTRPPSVIIIERGST